MTTAFIYLETTPEDISKQINKHLEKRMKPTYFYAEVDINDGDYVGDLKQVSPEDAKKLQAILERIGDASPWWSGDCGGYEDTKEQHSWLTEDDYEFLEEFLPYSEYGYHTLIKAKLFTMNEIFEI